MEIRVWIMGYPKSKTNGLVDTTGRSPSGQKALGARARVLENPSRRLLLSTTSHGRHGQREGWPGVAHHHSCKQPRQRPAPPSDAPGAVRRSGGYEPRSGDPIFIFFSKNSRSNLFFKTSIYMQF